MVHCETHPVDVRDGLTLSSPISPIACVSPGVSDICKSSSSSVVSDGDAGDGDAGLLSALLGPPSFRLAQHRAGRRSCLLPVPWTFRLIVVRSDLRVQFHAAVWLGRADFGNGCAFRSTTYRSSDYVQSSGKYGYLCTTPGSWEWIGAPESARLLDQGPSAWLHSL